MQNSLIVIGTDGPISPALLTALVATITANRIGVRHASHLDTAEGAASQITGTAEDLQGDLHALGSRVTLIAPPPEDVQPGEVPEKKKGGGKPAPRPKQGQTGTTSPNTGPAGIEGKDGPGPDPVGEPGPEGSAGSDEEAPSEQASEKTDEKKD